jgi:glycosyltransferase involved in cell wall biosynthesis
MAANFALIKGLMTNHCAPSLAIVMPCYNEQIILPKTLDILLNYLHLLRAKNKINEESFIYCIDDGSNDETWAIISDYHQKSPHVRGLKLTRNVGQQFALLAGLMRVKNKITCAVTIDADLQDDYNVIEDMLDSFAKGNDIVSGVRSSRDNDGLLRRLTSALFYKIMKKSGADIISQHAEFRLLSNRCIVTLSRYKERNLFLRGILPIMGYTQSIVLYERKQRLGGRSKYNFRKLIVLAWEGITSFSHLPLNLILSIGFFSFILSVLLAAWVLLEKWYGHTTPGWASIMIPLCFMGGIQLLSIGVIGEYIAKVYLEVKYRPRFIKDIEL